jgi:hypothetical protein
MIRSRFAAALVGVAAALGAVAVSCRAGRPATEADCTALLDRLVELELRERGLQDPALGARWRAEARAKFTPELGACVGRRLPAGALDCAVKVTTAEEMAHRCFR